MSSSEAGGGEAGPPAGILVVDDTPANLVALEAILEPLHQRVIKAASGREALRILLEQEVALILMDIRMTGLDGIETARLIRQRPRDRLVPIIFVTGFDRAEIDVKAGYEMGAADFIFKPFQPEALRAKVSVFVDLFQKTEAVRRQAERLRVMEQREHRRRLEHAESGRRQAEERFERMVELAPDGIVAVDAEGRIVLFNRGAEQLFDMPSERALGTELGTLLVGPLPAPGPVPVEIEMRRGKRAFPAEVSVGELELGDERVTTLVCRDITERRRAENRVRELNRELDTRLRTGILMVADLAATLNPREVTGRILRRTVESVRADQGTLLRVLESGRLVVEDSYDRERDLVLAPGAQFPEHPVIGAAVERREPVLDGPFKLHGSADSVFAGWLKGVRRTAALPLLAGDRAVAVLVLARRRDEPFGEGELEALGMIGSVAAAALRNAELFAGAEAASISKSEFLNMAAHELRTPLSVVTGYLSMLDDGSLGEPNPTWKDPVSIMVGKAAELNKLVDELLLAARMEADTVHGEPAVFDLRRAAGDAIQRAAPRARLLGAQVEFSEPSSPVEVNADPSHVGRILDNLINNSLTYSEGPPWVRVTVDGNGEGGRLAVEDRGLGIPDSRREAVFERFYRVNDPSLPPQPGTGLGLYLARELALRNGGTLALEWSEPGAGSRFALELPAPDRVAATAASVAARGAEGLQRGA